MKDYSKEWWKERLPYIHAFVEGRLKHNNTTENQQIGFLNHISHYQILEYHPYSIDNPEVLSLIGKTIYHIDKSFVVVSIGKDNVGLQPSNAINTYTYTYKYLLNNFSFSDKEIQPVGVLG